MCPPEGSKKRPRNPKVAQRTRRCSPRPPKVSPRSQVEPQRAAVSRYSDTWSPEMRQRDAKWRPKSCLGAAKMVAKSKVQENALRGVPFDAKSEAREHVTPIIGPSYHPPLVPKLLATIWEWQTLKQRSVSLNNVFKQRS